MSNPILDAVPTDLPEAARDGASHAALLAAHLADARSSWSVGSFGAIAEFHRDAGEAVQVHAAVLSAATERGALQLTLHPALRLIAYETPSADGEGWNHALALCLPAAEAAMQRRATITELGPDEGALRAADRGAPLFDLGLACLQVDFCVRSGDPACVSALRSAAGTSPLAASHPLMAQMPQLSPVRVLLTRVARCEVYQPIPGPGEASPMGPHTHLLPMLLRHGRTHSANTPLPEGWVPCAHLYPAHPLRDGLGCAHAFDAAAHAAFQRLYAQFADPALLAAKQRAAAGVRAGAAPPAEEPASRVARAALRVALRQLVFTDGPSPALSAWRARFDRADSAAGDDH